MVRLTPNTSLAVLHPDLAGQWHTAENDGLTPDDVTVGSVRKVWWRCANRHGWTAIIADRVRGSGCPYCSGRRATPETSLATLRPDLTAQWHPTANGDLTPIGVSPGSKRKVWWRCAQGHDWEAVIGSRSNGNGCPWCAGKRVTAETSLAALRPELTSRLGVSAGFSSDVSDP